MAASPQDGTATKSPHPPFSQEHGIHVSEADTKDLKILSRSDIGFAILYGILFLWGLLLTLLAI